MVEKKPKMKDEQIGADSRQWKEESEVVLGVFDISISHIDYRYIDIF